MRTTLNLDRDLLERAKAALGAGTYTETIERSLTAAIARADMERKLEVVRGRDLVWSLEELTAYRRKARGDAA